MRRFLVLASLFAVRLTPPVHSPSCFFPDHPSTHSPTFPPLFPLLPLFSSSFSPLLPRRARKNPSPLPSPPFSLLPFPLFLHVRQETTQDNTSKTCPSTPTLPCSVAYPLFSLQNDIQSSLTLLSTGNDLPAAYRHRIAVPATWDRQCLVNATGSLSNSQTSLASRSPSASSFPTTLCFSLESFSSSI